MTVHLVTVLFVIADSLLVIVVVSKMLEPTIGGFRDTYLGRQVVSRPGGPRAGMGQLEWASAVSSCSGVWGEIEFGAFLALKFDIRWHQFP